VNVATEFAEAASRLSGSIARLAATTASYVGERVEQMDDAIQLERRRWFWMALGSGAALLLLCAAIVFGGLAIVMAFRDTAPVAASLAVAGGLIAVALVTIAMVWRRMRRPVTTNDRIARILALFLEGRHLNH
jgi:uncharacterized membrane protein YqjE